MISSRYFISHARWSGLIFFVLVGLSFLWFGCGKKGPPRPPLRPLPLAVNDLSYAVDNQAVELSWTVAVIEDTSASSPVGYKIFRSKISAEESDCEKCPIRFAESADVPIEAKLIETSKPIRMRYTEVLEPGYRYIYKVISYDADGERSEDSNIIKFDHIPN